MSLSEFSRRVAQACRYRHPGAVIREVEEQPGWLAYLDVECRDEQGIGLRWPIGLAPHGIDDGVLQRFRDTVHAQYQRYERDDPSVLSEVVYEGNPVGDTFRVQARRHGVRVWRLFEYEPRWDSDEYLAGQARRLDGDPRYAPALYVGQRYRRLRLGSGGPPPDPAARQYLLDEIMRLLDTESARFVLVLGESGHGKSFLLRQLARRIKDMMPHLVPMLVELRHVDKVHKVDMADKVNVLVAQHLAQVGEKRIEPQLVRQMLARGEVALLFDGFDELAERITYGEASAYLGTLVSAVSGRAKVVLTSRTQHFRSDEELHAILAAADILPVSEQIRIAAFDSAQIRAYLLNLVRMRGGDDAEVDERLALINGIGNLRGLSQNPRMLSYIADLHAEDLRAARDGRGRISSADIYRLLVQQWLRFEAGRRRRPATDAFQNVDAQELRYAVDTLALAMWEAGTYTADMSWVEAAAVRELTGLGAPGLDRGQATHTLGSGSLLIRDGDDRFSFVDRSVLEYLVAAYAARHIEADDTASETWNRRPLSDLMVNFLCESTGKVKLAAWARRVLRDPNARAQARRNAFLVARRLGLDDLSDAHLAGLDLHGEDLSGLRLRSADLSGANLADADLHRANLAHADMRNADLRGARLHRATLEGVRVDGGSWDGAAGRGVVVDDGTAEELRQLGAAIEPGLAWDLAISYATQDEAVACEISDRLRREFKIFYAPHTGADLHEHHLEETLPDIFGFQSRFVLILMSPHYVRRRWTLVEYDAVAAANPQRILLLDLGGEPPGELPPGITRLPRDPTSPGGLAGLADWLRRILGNDSTS